METTTRPSGPVEERWAPAGSAGLVHWRGRWLLDVPGRGGARGVALGDPAVWRLLGALARRPGRTPGELRLLAQEAGVPAHAVAGCLTSLERAGLLRREAPDDPPPRDAPALHDWALANLAPPADYRNPALVDDDIALMTSYADGDPPPPALPDLSEHAPRVHLPHPVADPGGHPLRVLGGVLYLSHAVIDDAAIGPLPRSRRVPPSHGAAHPFDLSVGCRWADGSTTVHAYDPDAHALAGLADGDRPDVAGPVRRLAAAAALRPGDAVIAVHLAIRRVQWRYRTGAAYPTVFLDLGHLLEALRGAAEWHGAAVNDVPVPARGPLGGGEAGAAGPVLAARVLRTAVDEGS
ncbi:MarR family transcriptional regulator [Streptomyces roseolilacinus]|uniref:HTH marR-type domain-containing protein n=1 Tax=Streptomyces roseolilacinus TaxID=66904 RepID=A0A918ELC8_9ACTN|nr:MarR family transcriptional regulator [Streptomyces roseolilacinus]GGQ07089.1 hypothetical protein GCM10010249_26660 [Streptomyces roseolilacinus]